MITENGIVTQANQNTAWIKTIRSAACESCSSKDSCGTSHHGSQEMTVVVKNTIGAGDSSVSGFFASLMEQPDRIDRAVVTAATWGAQKVQQSTSQLLHLDNLPVVNLHRTIDLSRAVTAD